ncbi:hypothetical protein DFP73DRAFT_279890 [Morchella snyderi]|nr:hypothetical protein DFP73DRAFT_279890 [Morchella snyderi]
MPIIQIIHISPPHLHTQIALTPLTHRHELPYRRARHPIHNRHQRPISRKRRWQQRQQLHQHPLLPPPHRLHTLIQPPIYLTDLIHPVIVARDQRPHQPRLQHHLRARSLPHKEALRDTRPQRRGHADGPHECVKALCTLAREQVLGLAAERVEVALGLGRGEVCEDGGQPGAHLAVWPGRDEPVGVVVGHLLVDAMVSGDWCEWGWGRGYGWWWWWWWWWWWYWYCCCTWAGPRCRRRWDSGKTSWRHFE